jgi:hypothetical protein
MRVPRSRRGGSAPRVARPLWLCPTCGNRFANRNQWHSCVRWPLQRHFSGRPRANQLFDRLVRAVETGGPVTIVSSRTRIALMTRMRFASIEPRAQYLRLGLVLARRLASPRFVTVESYSPRNHVHVLELRQPSDIDSELLALLEESRSVGDQRHLSSAVRA